MKNESLLASGGRPEQWSCRNTWQPSDPGGEEENPEPHREWPTARAGWSKSESIGETTSRRGGGCREQRPNRSGRSSPRGKLTNRWDSSDHHRRSLRQPSSQDTRSPSTRRGPAALRRSWRDLMRRREPGTMADMDPEKTASNRHRMEAVRPEEGERTSEPFRGSGKPSKEKSCASSLDNPEAESGPKSSLKD